MANLEWFVSQFSPSQLRMYATSSDMTFGWNTLEMDFSAEENRVKLPARRSESILSFRYSWFICNPSVALKEKMSIRQSIVDDNVVALHKLEECMRRKLLSF